MKKIIILFVFGIILSISFVYAIQLNYFYSDTCPYCQEIKPYIEEIDNYYQVNWYEISNKNNTKLYEEYGFEGVPSFVIKTEDNREIKFTGSNPKKLFCELVEMSTRDCVTYSADNCIGGSWFIE